MAKVWYLNAQPSSPVFYGKIRGSSTGLGERAIVLPGGVTNQNDVIDLTATQDFEYLREAGTATVNIDVTGFIVTEVK